MSILLDREEGQQFKRSSKHVQADQQSPNGARQAIVEHGLVLACRRMSVKGLGLLVAIEFETTSSSRDISGSNRAVRRASRLSQTVFVS